jgi:eukaryotic-like serine/threonine-protein kinase
VELPRTFGNYYLLDRLAIGGMAEVFLSKNRDMIGSDRFVAIKKILPHLAESKEIVDLFIEEARIASAFKHPNIIRIIESGWEEHDFFIAMEFIRGKDLSKINHKLAESNRRMPITLTIHIISQLCEALAYAHNQTDSSGNNLKIIHQDISPGNLIISYDGAVKLADFGIATVKCAGRVTHAHPTGKFGYMSPEQIRNLPLDSRSDLFSVGILLYELLTGKRLFCTEQKDCSILQQHSQQMPLPSHFNSDISNELEQVVLRALAPEPDDRYETALKLQEDLAHFLPHAYTSNQSVELATFTGELFACEIALEDQKLLDLANKQLVQIS